MSNYLSAEELRGVANIIDALDNVMGDGVGFATDLTIYDSNGEVVGHIKNEETYGAHGFYPSEEDTTEG